MEEIQFIGERVRERAPGLATTNVTNEIARALSGPAVILRAPKRSPIEHPVTPLKISSIISGQIGRYNAKEFIEGIKTNATGSLSESDIGTLPSADDSVVWNLKEIAWGGNLLFAGQLVMGRFAGTTSAGEKIYLVDSQRPEIFPVSVTKDGGADGTSSAAATWTYTVLNVSRTTTFTTACALSKPRDPGSVNFGTTYGLAFYDGTTLKLWEAGESKVTHACS